jgi:hypothetical protein
LVEIVSPFIARVLSSANVSKICLTDKAPPDQRIVRRIRVRGVDLTKAVWLARAAVLLAAGAGYPSSAADAQATGLPPGAAIHLVDDETAMRAWLARVPPTREFPPDFAAALTRMAPAIVVEMSSEPGCLPCADLWSRLGALKHRYGFSIAVLPREEAMLRSGRLGLPWVGHPVAWVRSVENSGRVVPIAIGTDHEVNVARNVYLAIKMMTGVRPAVGVRAMARFTGIVAPPAHRLRK